MGKCFTTICLSPKFNSTFNCCDNKQAVAYYRKNEESIGDLSDCQILNMYANYAYTWKHFNLQCFEILKYM